MKISALNIRQGNVIEHNDKLYIVLGYHIIQPGKGAAVVQVEMREVGAGTKVKERFRTQEMVEKAHVEEREMQYLYSEGDQHFFMDQETFDQTAIVSETIGEPVRFLQDGMTVQVAMYESLPLSVTLPQQVTLAVAETEPVVKGQTATSSYKTAMLENGVRSSVPPHIDTGQRVVVSTADGSYVERAKD